MFDHHQKRAVLLFAAADVILTVVAFEGAYQTRRLLPLERTFFIISPVKALLLGFILVLWLALGRWVGAYARLYGGDLKTAVYVTLRQVGLGALGLAMFMFALRLDISRPFIGLFLLYNLILLVGYRAGAGNLRGWVRRQFGAEIFCVVVGEGPRAVEMAERIDGAGEFGVRLSAYVDISGDPSEAERLARRFPLRRLDDLAAMLRDQVIDEVFFVVDAPKLAALEEIFLLCDEQGVRTRVATHFFPHVNSRLFLETFAEQPVLTFSATPHDEARLLIKRTLDIAASAGLLVVLALPMLLIAALIRLGSRGPAIYSQIRCGLNGRRFCFYKFRSMVENAEALRADIEHLNEKDGPAFKIAADPRVTPFGRLLRRYSIDEWPQFWNILKGDMSFVGPRPAIPSEVEQYKSWQRRRLRMRPGLTCLWAINGRDRLDFDTWMKLDLAYIDEWSLWLDLRILLASIPLVLAGRGAH